MIIISADSEDEAADLRDLLGHHLAWDHRIYIRGVEYPPQLVPAVPAVPPAPAHHELLRQILRGALTSRTLRELTSALDRRGVHVERETVARWLRADAAAGLVRVIGRAESGYQAARYAWVREDRPAADRRHDLYREILRDAGDGVTVRQLAAALAARGYVIARETLHRWLQADVAAGVVRQDGGPDGAVWTYQWRHGTDHPDGSATDRREAMRRLLREHGPQGYTASRMLSLLRDRGVIVSRETLARWLAEDAAAGLVIWSGAPLHRWAWIAGEDTR